MTEIYNYMRKKDRNGNSYLFMYTACRLYKYLQRYITIAYYNMYAMYTIVLVVPMKVSTRRVDIVSDFAPDFRSFLNNQST